MLHPLRYARFSIIFVRQQDGNPNGFQTVARVMAARQAPENTRGTQYARLHPGRSQRAGYIERGWTHRGDARVGLLEAKLVSFGVGHHNPAAWAQVASVVNDRCAKSYEPCQLRLLIAPGRNEVQVDPVLDHLLLRNAHEYEPRQLAVRRVRDPIVVTWCVDFFQRVAHDVAPKLCDNSRVVAIEGDI